MAKGAEAKNRVIERIQSAFGKDYIGEYDKKIYVWADDGGAAVQIAISLTCPKNQIETANVSTSNIMDFENPQEVLVTTGQESAEISQEEREVVNNLLQALYS